MDKEIKKISKFSEEDLVRYFTNTNIDKLHEIKLILDDKYYNTGESSGFTDIQYDLLKEILQIRDPDYITPVGSKIRVGDNKATLPFWLGSMNKIKPEDVSEFERWVKKFEIKECVIEDKLDGVSCLLYYKDNKQFLYTRGDGVIGSDISYLLPYFKTIPKNAKVNVRGELIIKKKVFQIKYSEEFANPRNFVSGRISCKTIREGISDIDFIAYEIVDNGILMKPSEQLELLTKLGFSVVNHTVIDEITIDKLIENFLLFKQESQYEIDGIIAQSDVPYSRNKSGNPSYAIAFKMRIDTNIANAIVEEVEWNVSKWGIIKPRIRIKPLKLNGVTITYTTGFNAKYIKQHNIGPKTEIIITRSGDVIPFILEVTKSTIAQFPEMEYKWNESGVDIYTENNEDIMCIKLISSFFASLKIKHVSEATVRKMYDHGLTSILKILSASQEDFEVIEGFGTRLAERTYDNIHQGLKGVSLSTILGSSGVFGIGMGVRKIDLLLSNIPDILQIYKTITEEDLRKMINGVEGFSDKTTTKIVENLPYAEKFVEMIKPYISFKQQRKALTTLKNFKIVFSGFRDSALEEKIVENGGKVTTSVSKNTSIVIVADKDNSSSKIQKARDLNIPIYTKEEFEEMYF